jgi:hypothetical protein
MALRDRHRHSLARLSPEYGRVHSMCREIGALRDFETLYVRFGSLADIPRYPGHVRYDPESRHCSRVYEYTP